jgi:hypothetical protein
MKKKTCSGGKYQLVPVLQTGESCDKFMRKVNKLCQEITGAHNAQHPQQIAPIWLT